jgi:transposase-like protein
MPIICPQCASDNLSRNDSAPDGPGIPTRCQDCAHTWRREPTKPCPRCGSLEVDDVGIPDSWAYDDQEAARNDPSAAEWSYLDKTQHTCNRCHHSWSVVHNRAPYRPTS